MGILDNITKRYRKEGTSFLVDSTYSKNAPPSYVSSLIRSNCTNVEDLEHLDKVARYDPLATFIIYKLSENTFDDWFVFLDNDGNETMQEVQKEFKLLDAKRALTLALIAERTFGYSYLYTGKNRFIPKTREGGKIASLHTFTPIDTIVWDYDEVGAPKTMRITIEVGKSQNMTKMEQLNLPAEDFIFLNTRPVGRGYKGRSALEPIWSELIYLRELIDSMTMFGRKMGGGLFVTKLLASVSDELKAKIDTAYANISNRRALIIEGDKIDDVKFVGPAGATTDFAEHISIILGMIAAGAGIPKDILIGATAATLTGDVNIKSLFQTISQIQSTVETYIRELVKRMGYSNEDYSIGWNTRFAHDEEQQSKINMNDAQTRAIQAGWLTINEIRELEGYPPQEGGDRLKSDFQIDVAGLNKPDNKMKTADAKEQTRNKQGDNL